VSTEAIKSILKEQLDGYKAFLSILQREKECLINIDMAAMEDISKEKDTAVMRLRLLEEERVRLTRKFANDNGILRDITLIELGELTEDNTLFALRSQLLSLLQSIEEMNKFNSILISRSINYLRANTNFLSSFTATAGLGAQTTGALLSKEI